MRDRFRRPPGREGGHRSRLRLVKLPTCALQTYPGTASSTTQATSLQAAILAP
jgi:hypothetical protein